MKKLKLFALCLVLAPLFISCGDDDNGEDGNAFDPSLRITQFQLETEIDKQEYTFTYNATGVLTKVERNAWNKDTGKRYYSNKYTYERGADGKITKVTYVDEQDTGIDGAENWVTSAPVIYTPKYEGNNIVEITYNQYDNDKVLSYTWQDGKITRIKVNGIVAHEFNYTNGNYAGYSTETSNTSSGIIYKTTDNLTITHNSDINLHRYMPLEFYIFGSLDATFMSNNNWVNISSNTISTQTDEATNVLQYTRKIETTGASNYEYTNGVTSGYTNIYSQKITVTNHKTGVTEPPVITSRTEKWKVITKRF